jgi:broad specificity phosphatase PhoE
MGLIVLVRHGETDWNKAQRVMGTSETGLNETGKAQMRWAARVLGGLSIERLYCSPYSRTMESAEILAKELRLDPTPAQALREVGYGVWEGRLFSELIENPNYFRYLKDPSFDPGQGIEPIIRVQERAAAFLEETSKDRPAATFAVVSHGDVIRAALAYYMRLPLKEFRRIRIDNGSVSGIQVHAGLAEIKGVNLVPEIGELWQRSYIRFNANVFGSV